MRKVGRNDPCPCGSGRKYKRCCLEADEANNITRITSAREEPPVFPLPEETFADEESVVSLVEEQLPWGHILYQSIARHMVNRMAGRYDWEVIAEAVMLWHAYSTAEQPVTRKAGVFPAAIEYCINVIHGLNGVTQSRLAEIYHVSVAAISQRSQFILDFVEREMMEREGEEEQGNPIRMEMEKWLRDIGHMLEGKNFSSIEEVDAYISQMLHQPTKQPKAGKPASPKEKAQNLLYEAWEEPHSGKRVKLAKQALKLYPDSPDAYNILADEASTLEEAALHYKQGMLAGERDLGSSYMEENKGYFWGLVETRPYMRAKRGYAEACFMLDRFQEAIHHLEELLELNPADNQGARYLLSTAYIQTEQYAKAARLIETYDENSAAFNYNRILIEYGLNGISNNLKKLYAKARKQNPHVMDYLLGKKRLPRKAPEYVGFGDPSEAVEYLMLNSRLWARQPNLVQWMVKQ